MSSVVADAIARTLADSLPPDARIRGSAAYIAAGILPAGSPVADLIDLSEYLVRGAARLPDLRTVEDPR